MIRLTIGICIGVLITAAYYETEGLLSNSRTTLETQIENQYPSIREALANLSDTGISISLQEIVPTIRTFGDNLINDTSQTRSEPPFYYVQVGAFSQSQDGDRLKANLLLKGFLDQHIYVEPGKNSDLHRVLIGPYAQKGKAVMSLSWAHKNNFDGLIVERPRT